MKSFAFHIVSEQPCKGCLVPMKYTKYKIYKKYKLIKIYKKYKTYKKYIYNKIHNIKTI